MATVPRSTSNSSVDDTFDEENTNRIVEEPANARFRIQTTSTAASPTDIEEILIKDLINEKRVVVSSIIDASTGATKSSQEGEWIPASAASGSDANNNNKTVSSWPVHYTKCEKLIVGGKEQAVKFLENGNMIVGGNKEFCLYECAGPVYEEADAIVA